MALFGFRLGSPCLCVPPSGLWGLLPAASPGCCVVGPRQGTAGFWFVLKWANVSILAQAISWPSLVERFLKFSVQALVGKRAGGKPLRETLLHSIDIFIERK